MSLRGAFEEGSAGQGKGASCILEEVANCVQCGRELPSFSVGEQSDVCAECRGRVGGPEPAPVRRQVSSLEVARMFPVTSGLVAINVVVYGLCALSTLKWKQGSLTDFDPRLLLRWGADFGPLTLDREWWRVFTSMFLHGGLIHVGANMWSLWAVGPLTERIYGRYRYLGIYLLTGLGSSVASLALHADKISVGASGAICGVVGALLFPLYRRRVSLPSPALKSMLRSLAISIFAMLVIGFAVPVIDNAAHIGGLLAGLAIGAVITHFAATGADLRELFPKVAIVTLLVVGFAFAGVQRWHRDVILPQQAYLWMELGNQESALKAAQRGVERAPQTAVAHVALGDVFYRKGQYQDAVKEYEKTRELEPKDAYAAGRLGLGYVATGQMEKAEPLLREAIKDDPDDANLLENLGIVLAAQGKLDEAHGVLVNSVQKDPKSARAQYALGAVLLEQRRTEEAITAFREAVRLKPDDAGYKETLQKAEKLLTK